MGRKYRMWWGKYQKKTPSNYLIFPPNSSRHWFDNKVFLCLHLYNNEGLIGYTLILCHIYFIYIYQCLLSNKSVIFMNYNNQANIVVKVGKKWAFIFD